MSGDFFEYCLLADARLSPISLLLGLDGVTLANNREILGMYIFAAEPSSKAQLTTVAGISNVSLFLTYSVLLIEVAVVVAFAVPRAWIKDVWKHGTLFLFLWTTFPLAQVSGFGWLLTMLGMSQLKKTQNRYYVYWYLASFLMIYISKNPGIRGILQHLDIL